MTKQEIEARMNDGFRKMREVVVDAQKVDAVYKNYFRGQADTLSVTHLIIRINNKSRDYRMKLKNLLARTDAEVESIDFSYIPNEMEEAVRAFRYELECYVGRLPYNPL